MTNNVGLAFCVGDGMPRFTISIKRDNLELVMLNITVIAIIESSRHVDWSALSILLNLC
jgi:hypothetical protein